MGDTAASNAAALQVSISFGRFENDSLCWEKWSTFSPNKYLEEVEKCATHGSVAQKRAYFEAHYKTIAARKAELLAQEKQTEKDPFRSQYQNGEDLSCNNTCETYAEFGTSNTQGSVEGVKQETNSVGEIIRTNVNNSKEDVAVSRECQSSLVEGENEELKRRSNSSQIYIPEEVVCVEQEKSPNIDVKDVKEISHNVDNETAKASEVEAKDVTLDHPKVSTKFGQVSPLNREGNAAKMKEKPVLPSSKSTQISTPKSSRPTLTPTKTLASANSTKRGISSLVSGRKITLIGENRKVPSKSLHMSLSLDASKPDPAPQTTMRKSLFMEKMGDKDIVKRAFKSFQNSFNQPKTSNEDKSSAKEQVPSRGTEPRVPTSTALRKENGRSPKVDNLDKRSGNAIRPTLGLKSETGADKRKESSRRVEEKFNAKQVERTHIQLKSKDFRATPLPSIYGVQKASKSYPEKGSGGSPLNLKR